MELNLLVPPADGLQVFVHRTTQTWAQTPYIWSVLTSYHGVHRIRDRFERDPERLFRLIVWSYVMEYNVQYMDTHPTQAEEIVLGWRDQTVEFGNLFVNIKRSSLFIDTRIPADNDRLSIQLNANIMEACVSDAIDQQFTNTRNGLALLDNHFNRSTITSTNSQETPEMQLDDNWVRLYIVWNLSFCCTFEKPEAMCKLLIPSVVVGTGPKWLRHRVNALRMLMMSKHLSDLSPADWDMADLRTHFATHAALLRTTVVEGGRIYRLVNTVVGHPLRVILSKVVQTVMFMITWIEYVC